MRITGYCTTCRRIKTVRVHSFRPGAVQTGTCSSCEQKEEDKRRERAGTERR